MVSKLSQCIFSSANTDQQVHILGSRPRSRLDDILWVGAEY